MSSSSEPIGTLINRRAFLAGAAAALVPIAGTSGAETPDLTRVLAEIEKRHDESVRRIQEWIKQPTIAAENRGINEGRDLMMRLLKDAGCSQVTACPTDLHPGVFGTLDAGASKTLKVKLANGVQRLADRKGHVKVRAVATTSGSAKSASSSRRLTLALGRNRGA